MGNVAFWIFAVIAVLVAFSIGNSQDRDRCYAHGGTHFGWDCTDANGNSVNYRPVAKIAD